MTYSAAGGAHLRRPYYIGGLGDIWSTLVGDVSATARAQVYSQLADFQALPLRINRTINQLNSFAGATPTRTMDESANLSALQMNVSNAQAYWNQANDTVSRAITAISSGGVSAAGDIASAAAAMTLSASQVASVEQGARDLIIGSTVLDDQTKQNLLALGAAGAITPMMMLVVAGGGFLLYRFFKNR